MGIVRVRYKKKQDKDGYLYLETETFHLPNLASVRGFIYPNMSMFKIMQFGTNDDWISELDRGAAPNLAKLKKDLKKSLISLGVTFEDEIRSHYLNKPIVE